MDVRPISARGRNADSRCVNRILFLVTAHNSLSQRELIVCPILKTIIPESIWSRHRCLIVHPGPVGDRGPSSLDWAIELGMAEWGVTVLEATGEIDGGAVWATRTFRTREAGKSSLYRHEVRRAAIDAVLEAVTDVAAGARAPAPVDYGDPRVIGPARGR